MYNIKLRPCYGSEELLIEFSIENDDDVYLKLQNPKPYDSPDPLLNA